MMAVPYELLADLAGLLKERVGLHIKPDSYAALRLAMAARLEETNGAFQGAEAYLDVLRSDAGDEELRSLLPLVTVGKTSFFRDERQFRALAALMPSLLDQARAARRPVRIWSAGCATGEEVFSIAMTAAEAGALPGELELLGTDVNPEAVSAAARGFFDPRRVRDVQPPLVERYFEAEGDGFRIRSELRRLLAGVRPHNLVSAVYPRPQAGAWDLVFCRNVIIYFDTATTQEVLARFHAMLAPGGYLFLGYSESLFRIFEGFELTEVAGAFLYRRPEGAARPYAPVPPPPPPAMAHRYVPSPVKHVRLPAPAASAAPPAAPARPLLSPQEVLDGAVELFAEGRFGAARDRLERLLSQSGEDLAVRLTLGNLYGILRQPDRAKESYQAALALEPLSAEAHLFYGIHLLAEGGAEAASLELSRALFLDPDLALAHYYLGRCREAQRDAHRARLCYKNAIDAHRRQPQGKRQAFLGYYPDIPEDGATFARAAEYALAAL
jgi:chemotaxis protein methyltransferase CheR